MLRLLLVIAEWQLFSEGQWIESHVYFQSKFQSYFHNGRSEERGHCFLLELFPWPQAIKQGWKVKSGGSQHPLTNVL